MTPQEAQTSERSESPCDLPAKPGPPGAVAAGMLREHCAALAAEGGALLRVGGDGRVDIVAVWPPPAGES